MEAMKLQYQIHNCHTHLFTIDHIPKYFLSRLFDTQWARKDWVAKLGKTLFRKQMNKFAAFFYSATKKDQGEVLDELRGYYPPDTRFCALSVDFDYMNAGPARIGFLQQIEELHQVAGQVNRAAGEELIFPFLGIDPRRPELLSLVKRYVEEKGFKGFKLYPALGFFPTDRRLYEVYEYAQRHELPITVHCIPKNKNHFRGRPGPEMVRKVQEIEGCRKKELKSCYEIAQYLNHPHWYEQLLLDFPKLKLNFAHFGGNEEWDKYLDEPDPKFDNRGSWYARIKELIKKYPNVYADISFTVYDRRLYPLLKIMLHSHYRDPAIFSPREKILLGSDFYMLQKDYRERRFGIDLRGYLSDDDYWQIAEVNPRRFLANSL